MEYDYRLSWEVLDPFIADRVHQQYGKRYWEREEVRAEFSAEPYKWHATSVIFSGTERLDQYSTLKSWEDHHLQPVRHVKLERRPANISGWTMVPVGDNPLAEPRT